MPHASLVSRRPSPALAMAARWSAGALLALGLPLWGSEARADEASELMATLQAVAPQRMVKTAPKVSAAQVQKAIAGEKVKGIEIVDGVPAAKGYGLSVVNMPIEKLWAAVVDADQHAGTMPLQASKKIQGKRCGHNHVIFQYIDLPVISDRWWVTRIKFNSALYTATEGKVWELGFQDEHKNQALIDSVDPALKGDGVPISWTKGSWTMVALGPSRTFVQYYVWSDPGGNIPAGPASRFSAGAVEDTLNAVEKLAKAGRSTCGGAGQRPDGSAL